MKMIIKLSKKTYTITSLGSNVMWLLDLFVILLGISAFLPKIKWPMTQSHIEYGMQKAYDEDDKDEITNEKPKINKKNEQSQQEPQSPITVSNHPESN